MLQVQGLQVFLKQRNRRLTVVEDLNFSLGFGERLGIVGESGCGKSVTALALLNLLPSTMNMAGSIHFASRDGQTADLNQLSEARLCEIRGKKIGMVFQEPMCAPQPGPDNWASGF